MIHVWALSGGKPARLSLGAGEPIPGQPVWIDLVRPEEGERRHVADRIGVEPPTREEMMEIEASSRLYVEEEAVYLTTPVIVGADTPHPELGALTFILTPRCLITVRFVEPKSVETFEARAVRNAELLRSPEDALLGLLDAVIDRAADVLEFVGGQLDGLNRHVFAEPLATGRPGRPNASDMRQVMSGLGRVGDLVHKLRDSLAGLDRLLAFLATVGAERLSREQRAGIKVLARDLRSLSEHAAFLANRTGFLLDATLGAINIEQNAIIKIFSVVAVVFLPPTLIASIYGMNFRFMPELDWPWGYPLALLLMVISAIVPLLYFRRKGWL